jgi:hypothetical protein
LFLSGGDVVAEGNRAQRNERWLRHRDERDKPMAHFLTSFVNDRVSALYPHTTIHSFARE